MVCKQRRPCGGVVGAIGMLLQVCFDDGVKSGHRSRCSHHWCSEAAVVLGMDGYNVRTMLDVVALTMVLNNVRGSGTIFAWSSKSTKIFIRQADVHLHLHPHHENDVPAQSKEWLRTSLVVLWS